MTLDEAIVIKETPEPGYFAIPARDRRVANNLSIEALKRVKWHKDQHEKGYYELLPGETE